jgi:hypothetical protein
MNPILILTLLTLALVIARIAVILTSRQHGRYGASLAKLRQWYANNVVTAGFQELKDLAAQRIITINVQTLQTAIQTSLAVYTSQVAAILSGIVQETVDYKLRFQLPSGRTLQPLDAGGNPLPAIPTGVYDVALPIQMGGDAWGNDRISRAKSTVLDVDRNVMEQMRADADWLLRHFLAAVFTNVTWPYTDPLYGALTIQPLANADTVTYVLSSGVPSTDNHFFFQAAAIADATDPYATLYQALAHHPSNTGPFIAYISSSLVATTLALAAFAEVRDPDVIYSITNPVLGTGVVNPNDNQYNGGSMLGFGDRVLGKVDNMWIVEWSRLPAGYILGHASGVTDVVGMRQEPEAELQGLFPEFVTRDGNLYEYRAIRRAGFGVMNRIGAAMMLVGAGAYAIPSGYTAPLPA